MKIYSFILLAFTSFAHATIIFDDNFNSYTSGTALPTGGNWVTSNNSGGGTDTVQTDLGDVFGLGTSNQYLRMQQAGGVGGASANIASSALSMPDMGAISFDLSMPTTATGRINLRLGIANSNANTAFLLQFGTGSTSGTRIYAQDGSTILGSFTLGTAAHITVVYNNTDSAFSYDMGSSITGTVAANTMDIWLGSINIGNDLARYTGSSLPLGTALTQFNFIGTDGTKTADMWLDNVVVQSVPEPSTTAALAVAGLVALMTIRRRNKHVETSI